MQDIFDNFGIYIHVPFCAQNCDYCRFYKRAPTSNTLDSYVDCLAQEIESARKEYTLRKPETMFWGGGTPSILSEKNFEKIATALGDFTPSKEWTVEVAPTNATKKKLETLKQIGVTRISMGVQSFDENTLKKLGRKHTLKATLEAIDRIADIAFDHFSIDLIFGAEAQTQDDWIADIEKAATCPVDHISAYCLEFESATSSCAGYRDDEKYEQAEREGDFLETTMNLLPSLGFAQYEISNYAKNGASCLHNLSTWNMASWLGFGPAAASQFGKRRFRNVPDFDEWKNSVLKRDSNKIDVVNLTDSDLFIDSIIFGLRMNDGINLQTLCERFPQADHHKYDDTFKFLTERSLLEKSGDVIKLTARGRLVADAVAVELL